MESHNRLLLLTARSLRHARCCAAARRFAGRGARTRSNSSRPRTRPRPKRKPRTPDVDAAARHRAERGASQDQDTQDRQRELGSRRGLGFMSIEDFGTNSTYAAQLTYHVTEDFFFRGDLGQSTAGQTSFETLGGNIELLTGDERRFTYYSLSLGYNFLPGEVFLGRKLAMNSGFYLLGGIGSVKFAGDNRLTINLGAGYRVLPTDWLAIHHRSAGPRVRLRLVRREQGHQQHRNRCSARPSFSDGVSIMSARTVKGFVERSRARRGVRAAGVRRVVLGPRPGVPALAAAAARPSTSPSTRARSS